MSTRSAVAAGLGRLRTLLLAVAAGGLAHAGQHAATAAVAAPEPPAGGAAEEQAWSSTRRAGTVAAYQRYLELFPVGEHAEEAFRLLIAGSLEGRPVERLVDLEPAATPGGRPRERVVAAAALALY